MEVQLRKILLVEDSDQDAELTLTSLEEENLANEVLRLRDGVECMDYLLKQGEYAENEEPLPSVIFLDIKMPRKDGLQTLKEIRGHEKLKNIPVVLVTSSKEEQDINRGYDLHVNAYVVKPVEFEEFSECIKSIGFFWAVINNPPISKG